ncbi:hypothetical protein ACK3Z9_12745, partial [Aeromonas caviae]
DKIRSQTKPFSYLFQLVAAKDPVYEYHQGGINNMNCTAGRYKITHYRCNARRLSHPTTTP